MTAPAERSRPLRADAERNRRRILTAAREVFARRGLDAGLDEIARHAGVGTGTVYRRFPEKSLLIEALFEDRLDQMFAFVEAAATHPDPWEGLVEILESVTRMQIEDRGLKDVIFSGVGDKEVFRERRERFLPLVEQTMDRAKAAGVLRADVGLTDLGALQVMLTTVADFSPATRPEVWRRYLQILLDGLRADRAGSTSLLQPALTLDEFEAACGRGKHAGA
ncbi:TetR/AcrR family transcriptional regulator [Pseudonocardia aurantiaca]|uniref:TetR/AcrR family transcriptional regulator n=1 Tax=Pseudonocardia aurantiaca TaxID=75290 RepID=A0ABW4FNL9_9PSEU